MISKLDWSNLTSEEVCDMLSSIWEIHPCRAKIKQSKQDNLKNPLYKA